MNLNTRPEPLDQTHIESVVANHCPYPLRIETLGSVGSTNGLLLERAGRSDAHGRVLLAEQQTAGRGRGGRQWISPPSSNIYLSMGWRFPGGPQSMVGLSLAVGVAVADAIATTCGAVLQLKWPNDIVHPRGKVGGVLIETVASAAGDWLAVVGVGINVDMSSGQASAIDQPWVAINQLCESPCSRNTLAATMIVGLAELLADFHVAGFAAWRDRWEALDALRGQEIAADGQTLVEGIGDGVTHDGGLRIAGADGMHVIYAGDARLRRDPGLAS